MARMATLCASVVGTAFFVSLLLCAPANVAADDALTELNEMAALSRDGVIRLNEANYKAFAKKEGFKRNYALIVFFDASMLHDNHQLNLPGFRKDFGLAAKAYAESVAGRDDVLPLFFADVEFKQSGEVFRMEGVQSLPFVLFFGRGDKTKAASMNFNRFGKTFAGVIQFLKDNEIPTDDIKPPPPMTKTQMALLGVAIVVLTPFVATHLLTRKTALHDPRLWCLFGLMIYLFSVSGGMFNIIRNMPWYVPSREKPGQFVYFLQQGGNQFGVEGMVIGSFYTMVGLLTAFNVYVLPRSKSATTKRVVGMLSIVACAFAVRKVVEFEVWKQGYWVHGFWPTAWS